MFLYSRALCSLQRCFAIEALFLLLLRTQRLHFSARRRYLRADRFHRHLKQKDFTARTQPRGVAPSIFVMQTCISSRATRTALVLVIALRKGLSATSLRVCNAFASTPTATGRSQNRGKGRREGKKWSWQSHSGLMKESGSCSSLYSQV